MKNGKRYFHKLRGTRGETIAETLIALLISMAGLMMLAYMISSGSRMVLNSRTVMKTYYEANNLVAGQEAAAGSVTLELTPSDSGDRYAGESFSADYFINETINKTPVISYRLPSEEGGGTP